MKTLLLFSTLGTHTPCAEGKDLPPVLSQKGFFRSDASLCTLGMQCDFVAADCGTWDKPYNLFVYVFH